MMKKIVLSIITLVTVLQIAYGEKVYACRSFSFLDAALRCVYFADVSENISANGGGGEAADASKNS